MQKPINSRILVDDIRGVTCIGLDPIELDTGSYLWIPNHNPNAIERIKQVMDNIRDD